MDIKEFCDIAQNECRSITSELVEIDAPKPVIAHYIEQFWKLIECICHSRSYIEFYEKAITELYGKEEFKKVKEKANELIEENNKKPDNRVNEVLKEHNIFVFPGVVWGEEKN